MSLISECVASWEMTESSTGSSAVTRVDATGRGNDLTDVNTTASGSGLTGSFANSADFERSNNETLSRSDNADLSLGDFDFFYEIAFIMESDLTTGQAYTLMRKGFSAAANNFEFGVLITQDLGTVRMNVVISNGTTIGTWRGSTEIMAGPLYHALAFHDATNNRVRLYLNGNSTPDIDQSWSNGCWNSTQTFYVGSFAGVGNFFDGRIGPARVFKGTLTSDYRSRLWNGGLLLPYSQFADSTSWANHVNTLIGGGF